MVNLAKIHSASQAVSETATSFLKVVAGPAFAELGALRAKASGFLWKGVLEIALKARKFLANKGLSPQAVPLAILVPILEAGASEEDESMQERWAALLATAAGPEVDITALAGFTEILKELSSEERQILDTLSAHEPSLGPWKEEGKDVSATLYRLGLCSRKPEKRTVILTPLGFAFISACTPPKDKGQTTFHSSSPQNYS